MTHATKVRPAVCRFFTVKNVHTVRRAAIFFVWSWALVGVFGALAVLAIVTDPMRSAPSSAAWAITEHPRWDHRCLTHDDDSRLVAALAQWAAVSGVSDCGASTFADLRVKYGPAGVFLGGELGVALRYPKASNPAVMEYCVVELAPGADARVDVHEVGHCLGLDHSNDPAAVMWPWVSPASTGVPDGDDIAGARALFGLPGRRALSYWLLAISKGDEAG